MNNHTCYRSPVQVEGEDILREQFFGHNLVKYRGDLLHRDGGITHTKDAIEACHSKRDARLLHCLSKLLTRHIQTCQLGHTVMSQPQAEHQIATSRGSITRGP